MNDFYNNNQNLETTEPNLISKHNDSWLAIQRLHDSWINCKRYIRTGQFEKWKIEMDIIWLELYTDVQRSDDKDKIVKENKALMAKITSAKTRNELYFALMERNEYLRGLQDLAGKGGSYIDQNLDDFE